MREKTFLEKVNSSTNESVASHNSHVSSFYFLKCIFSASKITFIGVVLSSIIAAITTILLGKQFLELALNVDSHFLFDKVSLLAFLIFALALMSFFRVTFAAKLAETLAQDLKTKCWQKLLYQKPDFYKSNPQHEIYTTLTQDFQQVSSFVATSLPLLTRNTVILFSSLSIMAMSNWQLTLLAATLYPTVLFPFFLWMRFNTRFYKKAKKEIIIQDQYTSEVLANIQLLQVFNHQAYVMKKINAIYAHTRNLSLKALRKASYTSSAIIIVLFVATLGLLLAGLWMTKHNFISVESFTNFLLYSALFCAVLASYSSLTHDSKLAQISFANILSIINTPTHDKQISPAKLVTMNELLRLEHVYFSYPDAPERIVLHDLSLTLKKGETLAIVGPSGAGKSTLLSLIIGLRTATQGKLYLGESPYDTLSDTLLCDKISLVPQIPSLFSATVLDNLLIANPEATLDQVHTALEKSQLSSVIEHLPDGIHTYLSEQGASLSVGQKQRLTIARTLLRDPELLLLDEATSALDSQNADAVQKAIHKLMQGRTTIIIAHNLSTVMQADRIAVMNHGRIEVIGTHHELMQKEGLYQNLARIQFKDLAA